MPREQVQLAGPRRHTGVLVDNLRSRALLLAGRRTAWRKKHSRCGSSYHPRGCPDSGVGGNVLHRRQAPGRLTRATVGPTRGRVGSLAAIAVRSQPVRANTCPRYVSGRRRRRGWRGRLSRRRSGKGGGSQWIKAAEGLVLPCEDVNHFVRRITSGSFDTDMAIPKKALQ